MHSLKYNDILPGADSVPWSRLIHLFEYGFTKSGTKYTQGLLETNLSVSENTNMEQGVLDRISWFWLLWIWVWFARSHDAYNRTKTSFQKSLCRLSLILTNSSSMYWAAMRALLYLWMLNLQSISPLVVVGGPWYQSSFQEVKIFCLNLARSRQRLI